MDAKYSFNNTTTSLVSALTLSVEGQETLYPGHKYRRVEVPFGRNWLTQLKKTVILKAVVGWL